MENEVTDQHVMELLEEFNRNTQISGSSHIFCVQTLNKCYFPSSSSFFFCQQQNFIAHSSGSWKVQDQGASTVTFWRGPASTFLRVLTRLKERGIFWASIRQESHPQGLCFYHSSISQKPVSYYHQPLGIRTSIYEILNSKGICSDCSSNPDFFFTERGRISKFSHHSFHYPLRVRCPLHTADKEAEIQKGS